jgi:poly(3-hydroxybutyrate) depolymerase
LPVSHRQIILPAFVIGKTTRNLDASEVLWEFFAIRSR